MNSDTIFFIFISILWMTAMFIAVVPSAGRWFYTRFILCNEKIQNFFDSNPFR